MDFKKESVKRQAGERESLVCVSKRPGVRSRDIIKELQGTWKTVQ